MRIGLFSPSYSHNYGTVLQAFALQHYLDVNGFSSEYIQYCLFRNNIQKITFLLVHPLFLFRLLKNKKENKNALTYGYLQTDKYVDILKKNNAFCQKFIKYSQKKYCFFNTRELNQSYNLFIVGSDQTWSPEIMYHYSVFFLPFVTDQNKKASYACSFGTSNISDGYKRFLTRRLSSFGFLSCRDKSNAEMLTTLLHKEVHNVIDPTLLLNREEWSQYMSPIEMPRRYILCYILGEKQCISDYANKVGKEREIPVYHILTRPCHEQNKNLLVGIGCQEFLFLIANCELLVTDSFHGTIISINCERNVIAFDKYLGNSYDNGRLEDVLNSFGLSSHYHKDTDMSAPEDIDYHLVHKILEEKRSKSYDYLNSILRESRVNTTSKEGSNAIIK